MSAVPEDVPASEERPEAVLLTAPSDGVPEVVSDAAGLAAAVDRIRAGRGPIAIDTERAQGFRYTNRAYLVQIRREGSGTILIDPLPLVGPGTPGLSSLAQVMSDEWILHAASQDLPCLVEIGLVPPRLFDTELAARLLGYPRVALGTLTEELLGIRLLKEHSAADWSRRPLPEEWLSYAALDVELLAELRRRLAAQLEETGKAGWAAEEFAALVANATVPVGQRTDPWRRTSGIHNVHTPLGLAVVRELWMTRDEIAARHDRAPGRVLGDEAITRVAALATGQPLQIDRATLRTIDRFNRREARRFESSWLAAIQRVAALPRSELPPVTTPSDGPPTLRSWSRRHPEAAARWEAIRPRVIEIAERVGMPPENLVSPDALRRIAWQPAGTEPGAIDTQLAALGVRAWQRSLIVDSVVAGLAGS